MINFIYLVKIWFLTSVSSVSFLYDVATVSSTLGTKSVPSNTGLFFLSVQETQRYFSLRFLQSQC